MFCILQLQPYLLTMASKSSTGIIIISTTKSHAISIKYCSWQEGSRYIIHFIYTHSYPYICCLELCDRNSIISTSSVLKEDAQSEGAVRLLSGREKLIFQKENSRTPNITIKGYQIIQFTKTTVKESSFQLDRLVNIYITLHYQLHLQCQFLQ